jgi:hypothetical protein
MSYSIKCPKIIVATILLPANGGQREQAFGMPSSECRCSEAPASYVKNIFSKL